MNKKYLLLALGVLTMGTMLLGCSQSTTDTTTTSTALGTSTTAAATTTTAVTTTTSAVAVTTTTSTTTTTGVVSSAIVNKTKSAAFFAGSGGNVANTASSVAPQFGNQAQGIRIMAEENGGSPDTFGDPLSADGYVAMESYADEAVMIRYVTVSGEVVNASYMAGKTIASIEGWTQASGDMPGSAEITVWANNPVYKDATSTDDYLYWAAISGFFKDYYTNVVPGIVPADVYFAVPTPEAGDYPSYMQGRITPTGTISGEITLDISLDADPNRLGIPTSGNGSASLEVGDQTLSATCEIDYSTQSGDLSITGTTDDDYSVSVDSNFSGVCSGTLHDSIGSLVASFEMSAAGDVTVTNSTGATATYDLK